jgi:class 3 adenylate cyclase
LDAPPWRIEVVEQSGVQLSPWFSPYKAVRRTLVDPALVSHRGRIVKTTGDGMLVEFASAVDAVRIAVEIQRSMAEQNTAVPQDQRIEFPLRTEPSST